ncbi:MAG: DNA-protecting protein DprA [Chloroflexota bacterium]|nr:DNA-protecting protein DprA [Chloroflexota bacterium]
MAASYDLVEIFRHGPDSLAMTPVTDSRDQEFFDKITSIGPQQLLDRADQQKREAERRAVRIVTYRDDDFPHNLRESQQSPPVLFIRGALRAQDDRSVAIVGTREASDAGRNRAFRLSKFLCEHEATVVSGLARGIDTAAHEGALSAGGRTVAVVGTGLDRTYPVENSELADRIAASGAVVSQFPFGTPPSRVNFPMRNKTMALLSLATVVVEAGARSGAKMQADFALQPRHPKRYVFLLQSLIESRGETVWSREFLDRGAQPMQQPEDVLAVLPHASQQHSAQQGQLRLL